MKVFFLILMMFWANCSAWAESRIAILDFDLNDLTLKPNIPQEIQRTASIKPLLASALSSAGYTIVPVLASAQQQANSGLGYLFDHHDVAAELGKSVGADYVLVGRLHKPSFLFIYLIGHLIRVKDGHLMGYYITESKGGDKKLTQKAIESLAAKIDADLENRYSPPAPDRLTR